MAILKYEFEARFLTPAFLGDAGQSSCWRTPPFKAQLRQFWRMAYAHAGNFQINLEEMREDEGRLFGNAWLQDPNGKSAAQRSRVRLRLDGWKPGTSTSRSLSSQQEIYHPEVERTKCRVDPHLYLGYGPLSAKPERRVISAGESNRLHVLLPEREAGLVGCALRLMHRWGTVGGRSRNGWGSYMLEPLSKDSKELFDAVDSTEPLRQWKECLCWEWPHAIGKDDTGPLVWTTKEDPNWATLMRTLAMVKVGVRTMFPFSSGRGASQPEPRHWLSYPVTNHAVSSWNKFRLPNSLRFKVQRTSAGLVGVIFHVPHLPPSKFGARSHDALIRSTWQTVHELLDCLRLPVSERAGYANFAVISSDRRLQEQLNQVTLQRGLPAV
jgi:CRISPR-associated protein Cmr1